MKEPKHTPWPWWNNRGLSVHAADESHIALLANRPEMQANARLITEAPALLAALAPFTRLWQPGMEAEPDDKTVWITDSGPITVGDIRRAREAVVQAEGGR